MSDNRPDDLIKVAEARRLLGVAPGTMTRILRERLTTYENPLDKRQKLVSRAAVMALLPRRAEAA